MGGGPMRRLLVATVGAGAVGAVALAVWRPGIGWPLGALAVGAAAIAAGKGTLPADSAHAGAASGKRGRLWRAFALVTAGCLVAVAAIRAAPWFVGLCLGTAVVLTAAGLAGGRDWLGPARGVLALPG